MFAASTTFKGKSASKKAVKKIKKKHFIRATRNDERFAIIDLGTNSVRFDVYSIIKGKLIRFHREKRMIRLGDGVYGTGKLSHSAMERGLKALSDFRRTCRDLGVHKAIVFATSALRYSSNAQVFIDKVERKIGYKIKVISGKQESEYIAKGMFANLKLPNEYLALVDIGGGSTEITICKGKKILKQGSFELGANRLQQMFLSKGRRDLALREHIRQELKRLKVNKPIQFVVGSSGTIRNLGRILGKTGCQTRPSLRQDLAGLIAEMRLLDPEEIRQLPGVEKDRCDLLYPGAVLFEEILYHLGSRMFYSTSLSLRDGMLQVMLETKK